MNGHASFLLRDLEEAVSKGTPQSRLNALWRATDALVAGRFAENEIHLFDEIAGRLTEDLDRVARARLSAALAPRPDAPPKLARRLACDDAIEVAGPVLRESERLDVGDLVAAAGAKGQQHLLAISQRRGLPAEVTDVLVVRGSPAVARSVVANAGAAISDRGYLHLLRRSEGDKVLAEGVAMRRDVPRKVFRQAVAKVPEEIRVRIERERPDLAEIAAGALPGVASKDHFLAGSEVAALQREGKLGEDAVFDFAYTVRFAETAGALALLCELPADMVERALVDREREPVLIMIRALGYRWQTAMAVLFLGAPDGRIRESELARLRADFENLDVAGSRKVLALYRAARPDAERAATTIRF